MGLFQCARMPFGFTGAPSTFQWIIFRGLHFVTTYIDDVLMHSVTLQDHCNHLQQRFHKLQAAGLALKGKNCTVAMSKVQYLGHVFTQAGMKPDE